MNIEKRRAEIAARKAEIEKAQQAVSTRANALAARLGLL